MGQAGWLQSRKDIATAGQVREEVVTGFAPEPPTLGLLPWGSGPGNGQG